MQIEVDTANKQEEQKVLFSFETKIYEKNYFDKKKIRNQAISF